MKHSRYTLFVLILVLASFLTACSGAGAASSWPGITVTKDNIYSAYSSHIYSINPSNGSMNWRYPEKADSKIAFYANPLVDENLVIVGDFDHTLHGLNKATGSEQWVFSEAKGRWIAGPIFVDDLIIAPNADKAVYALNKNGLLQWKFETNGANWAQPTADADNVYVSSMDHYVYALRIKDGKKIWSTDLGGSVVHSQILGEDGVLYLGTLGSELIAVNSKSGNVLWKAKTSGSIWGKVVLNNGTIFTGDQSGKISAFSADSGTALWSVDAGGPVIGGGAVVGDALVFATETGTLVSVDFSGKKVWNVTVGGKLYSDVLFTGDNIIGAATGTDKIMQAFDKEGKEIWGFIPPK
jgi:eukaryotic-like serine/threonine-protein kinase